MPVLPSYRDQSIDWLTGFYMRATLTLNGLKQLIFFARINFCVINFAEFNFANFTQMRKSKSREVLLFVVIP